MALRHRSFSLSASLRRETRYPGVRSTLTYTFRDWSNGRLERGCWRPPQAVEEVAANLRSKRQQLARMGRRADVLASDCGHDEDQTAKLAGESDTAREQR